MIMDPIISVENLSKYFTKQKHYRGLGGSLRNLITRESTEVRAVDGVSFNIGAGECVGYIGPNGAGKSTTIKMLTGLLVPTGGKLVVNGFVPWRERIKYVSQIGVVFGQRTTLWWDLPVIESLDLLQHIYRIPYDRYQQNLNLFRDMLELDTFIDTPVRSLSLGQRMRADICAAMLHNPEILFLDEPTIGLDVVAKERIRQIIKTVNQTRATTVLLTTHDLSDVERLCERVLIIDKGHLLFDGALDELLRKFGGKRKLVIDFAEYYPDIFVEDAEVSECDGTRAVLAFARDKVTASELIRRVSQKYRIRDLSVKEPEIENTVRRIYEERLLD
jgi:ABC-2 type transport system ATP-binding protein